MPGLPPTFPSAPRWTATLDAAPLVAPASDGTHLVVALASGVVSARSLRDGSEIWSHQAKVVQPLVLDEGRVIVATEEGLRALRLTDGAEIWRHPAPALATRPVARGGWIILASGPRVAAIKAADGSVVWRRDMTELSGDPTIDGSLVFVPLSDGRLVALDLESGEPVWTRALGSAPTSPLVYGDRVYFGTGAKQFTCLVRATGAVAWSWQIGGRVIGQPGADRQRVYLTSTDNVLRALDRANGAQRWKTGLTFRPTSGPVLLAEHVTVSGAAQELPGFDAVRGKPSGKLSLGAYLAAPPSFLLVNGDPKEPAVATISGGMTGEWTLRLSVPPPPVPAPPPSTLPGTPMPLPVAPGAAWPPDALPGTVMPLPVPPAAPGTTTGTRSRRARRGSVPVHD